MSDLEKQLYSSLNKIPEDVLKQNFPLVNATGVETLKYCGCNECSNDLLGLKIFSIQNVLYYKFYEKNILLNLSHSWKYFMRAYNYNNLKKHQYYYCVNCFTPLIIDLNNQKFYTTSSDYTQDVSNHCLSVQKSKRMKNLLQ